LPGTLKAAWQGYDREIQGDQVNPVPQEMENKAKDAAEISAQLRQLELLHKIN